MPYLYQHSLEAQLSELRAKVSSLRKDGALSSEALKNLRRFFRIKNIYNSNAIEGNTLSIGETRLVVEQGLTITGKPLKDTLEAKNLSHALDLFEELADREGRPILGVDIRNLQGSILKGIDDENAGKYRSVNVHITGSQHTQPSSEQVASMMSDLTDWLEKLPSPDQLSEEADPIVLACIAHAWFVYIHPFVDGNGRTARLLMNLVLMRYGYPIAIINRDDRQRYYDALETSQGSDLTPFIQLVFESVDESLEEYLRANNETKLDC